MDPCVLPSSLCTKSTFLTTPPIRKQPSTLSAASNRHRHRRLITFHATGPAASSGGGGDGVSSKDDDTAPTASTSDPPPAPAPALKIRYRPRSRNQARRQQEEEGAGKARPPPVKKEWESMTLGEKAVELYVGEKGLLFWLNKLAYASIFVIIGGWILFRFVGPTLGLYQLDAPPLPPSSIFKGNE